MSDCGSGRQQAVGFLGRTESCLSLFSRLKVYLGGSSAPHARMDGAPDLCSRHEDENQMKGSIL